MNSDSKGVKRGRCQMCAECTEFEWHAEAVGSACTYCGCLPTKHLKIEENDIQEERDESIEEDASAASQEDNATESSSESEEDANSDLMMDKTLDLRFLIPETFSPEIQRILDEDGQLKETQKKLMVREVVSNMFDTGLTQSHVVKEIALLLTNKFPNQLRGTLSNPHGTNYWPLKSAILPQSSIFQGVTQQRIKNRLKHLRRQARLRKSVEKTNPQPASRRLSGERKDLKASRNSRMMSTNKESATDILKKYPNLKDPVLLFWELGELTAWSTEEMEANWSNAIPKLMDLLKLNASDLDDNGKSISVLFNLPKIFSKAKEKGKIFYSYPRGTSITSIAPKNTDAPRLLAVSDRHFNSLPLMCYVDGKPFFTEKGFKATLLLISVYWVFNIKFPDDAKQQFALIAIAILGKVGKDTIGKKITSSITLSTCLTAAGLDPDVSE